MTEELIELAPPPEPESVEETGLSQNFLEQLILKVLYFRGEIYGQDLSVAMGLKYSVIHELVEMLKIQHQITVKRSLGMGSVAAVLTLTEAGRNRAREYLDVNQYAGPTPVPLEQYNAMVRRQKHRDGWLNKESLKQALRGMVVTERLMAQVGPAISSANSFLIYGQPGDGKTFLIESLANLELSPIYLPYAIESQGNIIQVFDPIYHTALDTEEQEPSVLSVSMAASHDRRWLRCKRPFIVSGGELSLDMLDLRYNASSKIYEAPFQLKANNGIYLVDDFGRQKATPAEVLNRWIVPMERRVDYLSFLTGGKMTVPFETFLVFSTNLNPADLGDEAFLRRIQYKLLLRSPGRSEFQFIFERFCEQKKIACPPGLVTRFIDKHYKPTNRRFRRCHPRDVLSHALNLIHFEKLPYELNDELLNRAFESCFVQDDQNETTEESAIVAMAPPSCDQFWHEKLARIPTQLGKLVFLSFYWQPEIRAYEDAESAKEYGMAETARMLEKLHMECFAGWMSMGLEKQTVDLMRYRASMSGGALQLNPSTLGRLAPTGARQEELASFTQGLDSLLNARPADTGANPAMAAYN
ncbi:MAG TPA: hypothetical protein VLY24_30740 [Bryobacteraceae bacterium]|nr:hypothetical protein [Bryobacteraceae bacterium]